jgi:hypothetical protein
MRFEELTGSGFRAIEKAEGQATRLRGFDPNV